MHRRWFSQAPVRHQLLKPPVKLVDNRGFEFVDDEGCGLKLVDDGGFEFPVHRHGEQDDEWSLVDKV